jgi:DNA-binding YbaB/EbfC family protein
MDIMAALRQAQEMKKNYEKTQEELEQMTLTGAAAGGMVTADVSGLGVIKRVKIDRSVVNPDDIEMLEDLVAVAVGEAQKKAMDEQKMRQSKLMEGLPFKLPF